MNEPTNVLTQPSLMIVFAYAPAGLGHLRVTDALHHGLPAQVNNAILLRTQDASVSYLHHLSSIHPATRRVMEWLQHGEPEELFTRAYRRILRSNTKLLYEHMLSLIEERFEEPDTLLVVSTHFGLAHKLAALKEKLSQEKKIKIVLALQVTDDSPQRIWYVAGTDLIVVPSEPTKADLLGYGQREHLPPVRFEVLPYPVSPLLTGALSDEEYAQHLQQVAADGQADIQVAIPISGAAVGLPFFLQLIDALHTKSSRFRFQVVCKVSPYTQSFLQDLQTRSFVTLHTATTDREIVEKYERLYQATPVTLEVTKPSEQAFKALINPHQRGGAILLFSHPIGRQEYDNLQFMERHRLLPTSIEQLQCWEHATQNAPLRADESALLNQALNWRGIRLPDEAQAAANTIWWSLEQGLFSQMLKCSAAPQPDDPNPRELSSDGVNQFWQLVSSLLQKG
ncbi:MAG: glycosyltransferase family protein [Aggregatilineales bacterium]